MIYLINLSAFLLISSTSSLICPVYNVFNNETSALISCDTNLSSCTYLTTQSTARRCLGIYNFDRNFQAQDQRIRIRQLATIDDFEAKYSNTTDCILNLDRTGNNLFCQCNSDNCTLKWRRAENLYTRMSYHENVFKHDEDNNWFLPLIVIVLVIIVISIIVLMKYHGFHKSNEKDNQSFSANLSTASTDISHAEIDEFLSSNPTYQSIISHGKTSIIYRAWTTDKDSFQYEKKPVAVKVYHGQNYRHMFENEVQILRMIRHSTIVNFISHGWHDLSPYILLEYHEMGSLENYLRSHKLPWSTCYSFLVSLVDAIDYLHYEDLSPNIYLPANRIRKPVIVHRDIKSSNIVVKCKPELSLCLIDFGFAKMLPPILTTRDFIQIGTYRYMAPELLELAITHTSDALCKVDMYALALVLWEIVTQCEDYSSSVDYQLPYSEYLSLNETNQNRIIEILHRVVVSEKKRPVIHYTSNVNSKISQVLTLIEDCWKHEPESRLNVRPALYRLRRL
ncbi:unnamed protein product [Adineta ricciae]|uniref:receptor protein serine/threonine kinase n=1 Tax=Adineta ricciae TaxID=249248 RepID=A0A815ES96_ADIRI|nr:unnamed protein product [Adineta ricciae]CAF1337732.1 unnamed protein product [Adineta ricciae]